MDSVKQVGDVVRNRVDKLGERIISFDREKKEISTATDLSETDKSQKLAAAQDSIEKEIATAFGEGDESIISELSGIVELLEEENNPLEAERALMAIEIWQNELPGLREFLEYCTEMIDAHPGETTEEIRKSQKCVMEAEVVMAKISERVKIEAAG